MYFNTSTNVDIICGDIKNVYYVYDNQKKSMFLCHADQSTLLLQSMYLSLKVKEVNLCIQWNTFRFEANVTIVIRISSRTVSRQLDSEANYLICEYLKKKAKGYLDFQYS